MLALLASLEHKNTRGPRDKFVRPRRKRGSRLERDRNGNQEVCILREA